MTDSSPADHCNTVVAEVFSTITSLVFSELIVVLAGCAAYLRWEVKLFNTLRMMSEIRPFKLAFLLEGPSPSRWEARQLVEVLESVAAKGLLDFLDSPPSVRTCEKIPLWGRLVLIVDMKSSPVLTTVFKFLALKRVTDPRGDHLAPMQSQAPPTTCSRHESTNSACPTRPFPSLFPHEILELIVTHLTHHRYTLKMCSLTCRSWLPVSFTIPSLSRGAGPKLITAGWDHCPSCTR